MGYQIRIEGGPHLLLKRVKTADSFGTRFLGLMGRRRLEPEEGLLLKRVSCIHTCFMRFPICAVYLDKEFCVIDKETVNPWRCGKFCHGAVHVLETQESRFDQIPVGVKLVLEQDERERRI